MKNKTKLMLLDPPRFHDDRCKPVVRPVVVEDRRPTGDDIEDNDDYGDYGYRLLQKTRPEDSGNAD